MVGKQWLAMHRDFDVHDPDRDVLLFTAELSQLATSSRSTNGSIGSASRSSVRHHEYGCAPGKPVGRGCSGHRRATQLPGSCSAWTCDLPIVWRRRNHSQGI